MLLSFAIQSFAGLRRSEVMGLRWGDIGETSIRVTASNSKTDKGRGVEIQMPLQKATTARNLLFGEIVGSIVLGGDRGVTIMEKYK